MTVGPYWLLPINSQCIHATQVRGQVLGDPRARGSQAAGAQQHGRRDAQEDAGAAESHRPPVLVYAFCVNRLY